MTDRIIIAGMLNDEQYRKMIEQSRRVYDPSGIAPTIHTSGGGNQEIKIMRKAFDEQNGYMRNDGTVGALITDGSSPKHNNRAVEGDDLNEFEQMLQDGELPEDVAEFLDIRIRKLTPRECFRLMGFAKRRSDGSYDDSAYESAERVCSVSQLYKQSGNSIVVDVLENVFRSIVNGNDNN